MKSLHFKGHAVELTIVHVNDEELDSIHNGEVDSHEVRDEMNAIHSLYNILPEEGIFFDENDNEVEVNFVTLYCSKIGEPFEKVSELLFDDMAGFLADFGVIYGDAMAIAMAQEGGIGVEIQAKLINAKQFLDNDEDDDIVLSDPDIEKTIERVICGKDLEDIEILVSVISVEKGYWKIEIPEGFDLNKPITIGTYEIECSGQQVGAFIMQYNNEKILLDTLTSELDSSETKSTVIVAMTDIEYDKGFLESVEINEIG
jgi:hypothetical protein